MRSGKRDPWLRLWYIIWYRDGGPLSGPCHLIFHGLHFNQVCTICYYSQWVNQSILRGSNLASALGSTWWAPTTPRCIICPPQLSTQRACPVRPLLGPFLWSKKSLSEGKKLCLPITKPHWNMNLYTNQGCFTDRMNIIGNARVKWKPLWSPLLPTPPRSLCPPWKDIFTLLAHHIGIWTHHTLET